MKSLKDRDTDKFGAQPRRNARRPLEVSQMTDQQLLERISLNPKVMVGKPVIAGTRLTVEYILNLLAHGASQADILAEYKSLRPEDIQACLLFATKSLASSEFMPLMSEAV